MLIDDLGNTMTDEEAQEMIRETFARKGCFILSSPVQPRIGEVHKFAGLPMRVSGYCTYVDAVKNDEPEWGQSALDPEDFYFYVEVAD